MRSSRSSIRDDRGASAVEYALLTAFVAAIVVGGVVALGELVPALYEVAFAPAE